jgi:RNA recognition motif-containing protein
LFVWLRSQLIACVFIRPVEIKRSLPPPRASGSSGSSSNSTSVFVSNLPTDPSIVSSELLRDAFAHCGTITSVVIPCPSALIVFVFTCHQRLLAREDGTLRGLAQVQSTREHANKAAAAAACCDELTA